MIANKIKGLRGFGGGAGVECGTRGRKITDYNFPVDVDCYSMLKYFRFNIQEKPK